MASFSSKVSRCWQWAFRGEWASNKDLNHSPYREQRIMDLEPEEIDKQKVFCCSCKYVSFDYLLFKEERHRYCRNPANITDKETAFKIASCYYSIDHLNANLDCPLFEEKWYKKIWKLFKH